MREDQISSREQLSKFRTIKKSTSSRGHFDHKTPVKKEVGNVGPAAPKKAKKVIVEVTDGSENEEDNLAKLKAELNLKIKEVSGLRKKSSLKQKTLKKTQDLEMRNKKLSDSVEILKSNLEEEKVKNEDLENKVIELENEADALKNESSRFSNSASKSREDISRKSAEDIRRLKKENNELKADLAETNSYLRRVRGERDALKIEKRKLESNLDKLRKEHVEKEEVEDIKAENIELKKLIKEKSRSLEKIKADSGKTIREQKVARSMLQVLDLEKEQLNNLDEDDTTGDSSNSDNLLSPVIKRKVVKASAALSDSDDNNTDNNSVVGNVNDELVNVSNDGKEKKENVVDNFDCPKTCYNPSQDMFDSVIFASDEEWADDFTRINNVEVFNYKNPKDCAAKSLKAPLKYTNGQFKPVICSLNNLVNFIAVDAYSTQHDVNKKGSCGLKPICKNIWGDGTMIAKLYILGTENHPNNETERWCCVHHSVASGTGFLLQTQVNSRKKIRLVKVQGETTIADVVGVNPLPKRGSNRLSLKKGNGSTNTSLTKNRLASGGRGAAPSCSSTTTTGSSPSVVAVDGSATAAGSLTASSSRGLGKFRVGSESGTKKSNGEGISNKPKM